MKTFSQFAEDSQQTAVSAHKARTAGMRQATSGTVSGYKAPFKKRPSIGLSKLLLGKERKKPPTQSDAKKPNITPLRPKTKPNPITKGLGARPA